jgi:putative DNA primase/helicase
MRAQSAAAFGLTDEQVKVDEPRPRIGSTREDTSNGERFAAQHQSSVRYACQRGKWLVWDGCRWKQDGIGLPQELAKQTARSIYAEAADLNDDEAPAMAKWAEKSLARDRLNAMLGSASTDPRLTVTEDLLDADSWMLNCPNGTVNLRNGEFHRHRKEDLITKVSGAVFDLGAECPKWKAFLQKIFQGNADLIAFMQRASGYTLSGWTGEQCWFFLHGAGENGKGTYIDVMHAILADYSPSIGMATGLGMISPQ